MILFRRFIGPAILSVVGLWIIWNFTQNLKATEATPHLYSELVGGVIFLTLGIVLGIAAFVFPKYGMKVSKGFRVPLNHPISIGCFIAFFIIAAEFAIAIYLEKAK